MENLIFFLLLISFCLGQLGRFSLFRSDLVVHLNDIAVGVMVIGYFLTKLLKKEKIYLPEIFKFISAFFLIGTASLLVNLSNFNLSDIAVGSLYLVRWGIYTLLFLAIFNWSKEKKDYSRKIQKFLIFAGTITALLGLFQYLFFPDLRPLKEADWDPHLYRVVGTFFDPGFIGAILVLNLIILVNNLFVLPATYFKQSQGKLGIITSLFLSYFAMILTYSRSTYLMFLGAMFLIAVIKKSPKFFLTVLLIFLLTLMVIPKGKSYGTELKREETFWARFESWQKSLEIFKKNSLLGVGFNNYRYAQIRYGFIEKEGSLESHAAAGSDNSFLFILATTGILGFFSYLLIFVNLIKTAKKKRQFTVLVSILAVFSQSFFINSLFYPFIMEWLWVLAGASIDFKEKI